MNQNKEEISKPTLMPNLIYLCHVTKTEFVNEVLKNFKNPQLFAEFFYGVVMIFDALVYHINFSSGKELDLNILKYISYESSKIFLEKREKFLQETALHDFLIKRLQKYKNNSVYCSKLDALGTEINNILATIEIDYDLVLKKSENEFKFLQNKLTQKRPNFFTKLSSISLVNLLKKLSLYHACYIAKRMDKIIRLNLIIAHLISEEEIFIQKKIEEFYENLYSEKLIDDDKIIIKNISKTLNEVLPLIYHSQLENQNPFLPLPPEIKLQINEYLIPNNNNIFNVESYSSLLNFARVCKMSNRMVNLDVTSPWKYVFKEMVNQAGLEFTENVNLTIGYADSMNCNTDANPDQTINYKQFVRDFFKLKKNYRNAENIVLDRGNLVLQHLYLRHVLTIKAIWNFKANETDIAFFGSCMKMACDGLVAGNLASLFVITKLLQDAMMHSKQTRFLGKARTVIVNHSNNSLELKKSGTVSDAISVFLEKMSAKIASVIFNNNVPQDFDFNSLQPWMLAFVCNFKKTKEVFLQVYKTITEMNGIDEWPAVYLSRCENPVGVLEKMKQASHAKLLKNNTTISATLLHLDKLEDLEVKFFFRLYDEVVPGQKYTTSLEILFRTKQLFKVKKFLSEQEIFNVCTNHLFFIDLLCAMPEEKLKEMSQFQFNFLGKYSKYDRPDIHVVAFICHYNLQDLFLKSPQIERLLNIISINKLFKNAPATKFLEQKLRLLFSEKGEKLLYLLENNSDLLFLLQYDYPTLESLAANTNEKFITYLLCTKLNLDQCTYVLKHPNLFIQEKLNISTINVSITGQRLTMLDKHPGRFEHWSEAEIREFFSVSRKVSESVFNSNVLTKLDLFFKKYSAVLVFEDLKMLAKDDVFDFVKKNTVEQFIILYKIFTTAQIIELSKTVINGENKLNTLLTMPSENLSILFQATNNNFFEIKSFVSSSVCKTFIDTETIAFFMQLYKQLGIKGLEKLESTNFSNGKNVLQTMLNSRPELIYKLIENSGSDVGMLINLMISQTISTAMQKIPNSPAPITASQNFARSAPSFFANPHKRKTTEPVNGSHTEIEDQIAEFIPKLKKLRSEGRENEANVLLKMMHALIGQHLDQAPDKTEGAQNG